MAQVKFGTIVTDMKGKVGGNVFQGSVSGGTMKKKNVQRSQAQSGKLTKADATRLFNPTASTTNLASSWRDLTEEQRNAWTAMAPNYPFINKFGEEYVASGYQLYMSTNLNLLATGNDIVDTPVSPEPLPEPPAFAVDTLSPTQVIVTLAATVPAGHTLSIYATRGMSAGRKPQKGDFKLLANIDNHVDMIFDETSMYFTILGTPISGATVWFSGKLTKADATRSGSPSTISNVVS